MAIRSHTSAESARGDNKQSNMSTNCKDEMVDENEDKKDESVKDNMTSDSQSYENKSEDSESGTLGVSDDPRRGARLKDTASRETESGASEILPTDEVSSNNRNDESRVPAGTNYKDDGQSGSSMKREEESIEDSTTPDDKIGNDLHIPAIILKRERKHSEISIRLKDEMINGDETSNDPCISAKITRGSNEQSNMSML